MLSAKPYYLLGADEAGRGCLVGDLVMSVVGAAVHQLPFSQDGEIQETIFLSPQIQTLFHPSGKIQDSKAFHREEDRWEVADEIWSHIHDGRIWMAMRERTSREVDDSRNINNCVNNAWIDCVDEIVQRILTTDPSAEQDQRIYVIIDGNSFCKTMRCPFRNVVRADALFPCVSAASILAKCAHDDSIDRILRSADSEEERKRWEVDFGWLENKGYATKKHREAIEKYGPTIHHRMSFEPCKSWNRKV